MSVSDKVQANSVRGPSGFLEIGGQMLVVDFGRIYQDGNPTGVIYDDGYLQNTSGLLGTYRKLRPIEAVPGCVFRGIDSNGLALVLPSDVPGPTGSMKFNNVLYHVVNGRIAASDHSLIGEVDDELNIFLRDKHLKEVQIKLDENTQLNTVFSGKKSSGEEIKHEWFRPLMKQDKNYSEAEMIRYFMDYDKLKAQQKKYLFENLKLWACCGMLHVVRKKEGNCALGNVKHGAAGQTGVRTGNVTLDKDEFNRDINLYYEHGCFAVVHTKYKPLCEVRVNLVVAHEFGHQLEFILSQATQDRIKDLYRSRKKLCDEKHPLPDEYPGASELLPHEEVMNRLFISGYARSSHHEYWAECVAAYTIKESRRFLERHDPAIYAVLNDVVFNPEKVVQPNLVEWVQHLQAALRVGGEFSDQLLSGTT